MTSQATGDMLAEAALEEILAAVGGVEGREPVVALGAGQTAARVIRVLSDWRRSELDAGREPPLRFVTASNSAEILARDLGLPVIELAMCDQAEVFVDGADEVDRSMRVMKGSRGSMARERVLAWMSARNVYIVRSAKVTKRIGEQATLSVAVQAFALAAVRAALRDFGVTALVRRTMNGELFITDNGNLLLDMDLAGDEDLPDLASALDAMPGVVDHGLFLGEADLVLIEHRDEAGLPLRLERLEREGGRGL